jgi:adenylate kinase
MLLGAPGAGKGTVAKGLVQRLGYTHLSTGDMLRAAVVAGTETGKLAKGFMEAGQLVPDDVIIRLIDDRTAEADCKAAGGAARFMLDGFPRTLPQADALDASGLGPECVVYLAVDDEVIVGRLTGRRSCPGCGAPYHIEFQPPKVEGVCDACGTALVHRADDHEGPIRQRLEAYANLTAPLVERYADRLVKIDGTQAPATVLEAAVTAVTVG